ncbi:hypothetical protein LCGC14_2469820 [marine sediment metagenome]|uniref:Uncharacterized protein n=1 Tax=marine sediment metagenome TaxID=412755 RepID=A0A0F9BBC9_9ZZZZ
MHNAWGWKILQRSVSAAWPSLLGCPRRPQSRVWWRLFETVRDRCEHRLAYVAGNNDWYLVSSHGSILFYVAANPDCTISEIADAMSLTRRTVWGVIGDLRRAGTLHVRKEGRRHHYSVNLDAPFLHPTLRGYTLRPILAGIVETASGGVDSPELA